VLSFRLALDAGPAAAAVASVAVVAAAVAIMSAIALATVTVVPGLDLFGQVFRKVIRTYCVEVIVSNNVNFSLNCNRLHLPVLLLPPQPPDISTIIST
jgi:hypothetical protein